MKRDDGSVILKNPATVHVSRMLENLLLFMKYVSIFHVTFLDLSNQLPFPLFKVVKIKYCALNLIDTYIHVKVTNFFVNFVEVNADILN